MRKVVKIVLMIPVALFLSINLGKLAGYALFKFIMWLGILPYLEKFFGWFLI